MNDMRIGVVIPVGGGRLHNLLHVMETITQQTFKPVIVALVCDGPQAWLGAEVPFKVPTAILRAEKHEPGREQPRNLGVRLLEDVGRQDARFAGLTHIHFCDTDVILRPRCFEFMREAALMTEPYDRVMIGPYEWLPPNVREPVDDLHNDPRWASFEEHDPDEVLVGDLGAGLACFSGNIMWPVGEFKRVGGFWDELHHGRCEDGEIGLRATAMGVPMSFVRQARGWHLEHDRNMGWIQNTNAIDVPKINERHPWVEEQGLVVVEEDGKRFNVRCQMCGDEMNTAEIWEHRRECAGDAATA